MDNPALKPALTPRLLGVVVLAVAVLSFCTGLILSHGLYLDMRWPSYADTAGNLDQPIAWLRWVLGDLSEYAFYKHELAGLGLLAGAGLAWWANRNGWAWQGFAIAYGSGLWPWMLASALLGLLLSNLLWGWAVSEQSWQATFVPFVSLPAATVLLYGRGWKVAIAGALLGALLVAPASLLLINHVTAPLGLPNVVGAVSGMALGSCLGLWLCRPLAAWLQATGEPAGPVPPARPVEQSHGLGWMARRVLADFSEAPFFGNELASLGLLGGILLAYALSPDATVYGSGLLLPILAAQALASAVGVLVWRRQWIRHGWYPTYIPLVSVAPAAVLVHGGTWPVVLIGATLGALIAPPLAKWLGGFLPGWLHGFIANVISMALGTLLILPLIGLVLHWSS
ncbi:hypothetical protein [Pseudomonas sp. HR96]|uniref:hypothetical protein n=1 Tax=Pseudomonas sp. HR96 TaxID=1027966 RepID=UPI0039BE6191